MTEPTTDELARWAALADTDGRLVPVAQYVVDAADAITRLLALVAAQAEQIARHDDMRLANYAKAETDKARKRAEQAEVKLARVRALCDRAEFHAEHGAMGAIWPHDVRAILDGTEDPA